jgi:hypothetical protein
VGLTLLDEMDTDIHVNKVDKRTLKVKDEFRTEQPTSITLKGIMESKIQEVVLGYRSGTQEEHANQEKTNEKPNEDNKDNMECQWCNNSPCAWDWNSNIMVEWDEKEHDTWLAMKSLVIAPDVNICTDKWHLPFWKDPLAKET